ncbi:MAG: insulinase family protein [Chloroflexi bacterium]|uniref:M16 family metallopeptidase n=1 Tax=Candidatus Flexifilum breve TaxID=3140694 RepID=UPI0031350094|nr:insulinase family protein [Chloroflexota bacterium]
MSTVTRHVLDNGLVVILKEVHTAPIISWWVLYRVGSRNERTGTTGVSHWVEHMLFKGTDQFPPGYLDKAIDRLGGSWNAQTFLDYTAYYETLPAEHIDLALQIEADRMMNAKFDPKEVDSGAHGHHLRTAGRGKLAHVLARRRGAGRFLPRAWLSPRDHRRHDRPRNHDAG